MRELKVAEVLTILPREGFFKKKKKKATLDVFSLVFIDLIYICGRLILSHHFTRI